MSNNKQRSATERLNDIEQIVGNLFQQAEMNARELQTAREAVIVLGKKVDAMAQLLSLSDDQISAQMNLNQLAELKARVDDLITRGILVASDKVGEQAFLVGSEVAADGTVVAARVQFVLASLAPEVQEKLKGAAVGSTVEVVAGVSNFTVLESYDIRQPAAPVDAAGPTEVPTEAPSAEAAPAPSEAASS